MIDQGRRRKNEVHLAASLPHEQSRGVKRKIVMMPLSTCVKGTGLNRGGERKGGGKRHFIVANKSATVLLPSAKEIRRGRVQRKPSLPAYSRGGEKGTAEGHSIKGKKGRG